MTASGACLLKAGKNVSTDLSAGIGADAKWEIFIGQAESVINSVSRVNWSDNYAGLDSDVQKLLDEITSNIAAMYAISYDMSGYTSRAEAGKMLDVLNDGVVRGTSLLKGQKRKDFVNAT